MICKIALLLAVSLVAGCAAMSGGPHMSVDELKAMAQDKNAGVICSTIMGPWGTGKVVAINLDQGVVRNGSISVDANCLVGITNTAPPKEPKPEAKTDAKP